MIIEDRTNHDGRFSEEQRKSSLTVSTITAAPCDCQSTLSGGVAEVVGPFPPCDQCDLKRDNRILRCQSAYWQAMHQKAKDREAAHIQEKEALQARVKQLESMVFAQSSEKNAGKPADSLPDSSSAIPAPATDATLAAAVAVRVETTPQA